MPSTFSKVEAMLVGPVAGVLAKRYAELRLLESEGHLEAAGRRYRIDDQPMLSVMGLSSGMLAVLVFALYINHDRVTRLYEHPEVLWIICPLLLYWITCCDGVMWRVYHAAVW